MTIYTIKKGRAWCGEAVGILVLDEHIARAPGSVNNALTFPFPVRYKKVKNASVERLLKRRDPELLQPFLEAAGELEDDGVGSIAGGCGFMALFQEQVADAVDIPVFLSSLLQLPLMLRSLNRRRKVGIITADSSSLGDEHYRQAGVADTSRIVVEGLQDQEECRRSMLEESGDMDTEKMRREVLAVARRMIEKHPDVGSILLECSELPAYGKAVRDATGLPVFDFATLLFYARSVVEQREYGA
jgi:aspartate/glutamate racemase